MNANARMTTIAAILPRSLLRSFCNVAQQATSQRGNKRIATNIASIVDNTTTYSLAFSQREGRVGKHDIGFSQARILAQVGSVHEINERGHCMRCCCIESDEHS